MTSWFSGVAGDQEPKNTKLYYYFFSRKSVAWLQNSPMVIICFWTQLKTSVNNIHFEKHFLQLFSEQKCYLEQIMEMKFVFKSSFCCIFFVVFKLFVISWSLECLRRPNFQNQFIQGWVGQNLWTVWVWQIIPIKERSRNGWAFIKIKLAYTQIWGQSVI